MQKRAKVLVMSASFFVLLGVHSGALAQDSARSNAVALDEREALIALYNATGGSQWTKKSGWMGAPGTECEWYGVTCDYPAQIRTRTPFVVSLDLPTNNLVGAVSPELGRLNNLEWLSIFGNHLTGTLPDSLIQHWLAGQLHIAAEAHLLTRISKIDYESDSSSLLCARQRIVLDSDQSASVYATRCRNATRDDRTTYCEVKEGQVGWAEFSRLALTIEKAGFFTMQPKYFRNITDAGFEDTRIIRAGKSVEVSNYADAGPSELWGIQRTIEGVAANIEVNKTTQTGACPRWKEPQ